MDEIIISPRIRWDSKTNEIVGFCCNHTPEHIADFRFTNYPKIHEFVDAYSKSDIHISTEALVITTTLLNKQSYINPSSEVYICKIKFSQSCNRWR